MPGKGSCRSDGDRDGVAEPGHRFLLRAREGGVYTPAGATGGFVDVPASHWAAAWIEQLAAESISTGCGGGAFCPSGTVARDQMAVFLVKTFNLP